MQDESATAPLQNQSGLPPLICRRYGRDVGLAVRIVIATYSCCLLKMSRWLVDGGGWGSFMTNGLVEAVYADVLGDVYLRSFPAFDKYLGVLTNERIAANHNAFGFWSRIDSNGGDLMNRCSNQIISDNIIARRRVGSSLKASLIGKRPSLVLMDGYVATPIQKRQIANSDIGGLSGNLNPSNTDSVFPNIVSTANISATN
jgi:hypothetical protein